MTKFCKKQIYLLIILFFGFSCGLKDQIDEAYIEISGNLSHNGNNISIGIVLLLEGDVSLDLAELSLDLEGLELSNGSISLFNGNYTIFDVEEGEYYIVAIEDNNGNLEYDSDLDRVGLYGFNPNVPVGDDMLPDL